MADERTFIMIKPDGVQRRLVGEILSRFERKGLRLVGLKLLQVPRSRAEEHYEVHKERPFYGELVDFVTSGPVVAMAWEGPDAIALARKIMGATRPSDSVPGTIRGDYAVSTQMNLVHGSDGPDTAATELALWFGEEELVSFENVDQPWLGE